MRKLLLFFLAAAIAGPILAQDTLSLQDAVSQALQKHPATVATSLGTKAAADRVTQARSGMLPKINVSESFVRSNNPVFVFGALLTQHQFGPGNFAIDPLNRPPALNNFQSQLTVDQPLFDGRQTRNAVRVAELGESGSKEDQRRTRMEVVAQAAQAYHNNLLAIENLKAAEQAVRSAEADLQRAETIRTAGMSTDADVLSIRVHLASVNEQRINRRADLDIARASLNDAIGLPLDTPHTLSTVLSPVTLPEVTLATLEHDAADNRPELRQSRLAASLAQVQNQAARDTWLPQVGFRGIFETDAQRLITRGGANWLAAVTVRWNLFNGFADQARISESGTLVNRAKADEQRTGSAVRLQVRQAHAGLQAAHQRIDVARAAVTAAEESLRITQNRYEAGLANVTDLLRTETALLETRTRYLAAVHAQRIAAVMVEFSSGRLSPDSEVLK